jgi:hypothetical protein
MKKKRLNWLEREKLKDPNYNQKGTQLLVQKLPPDLIPRMRKCCEANGLKIRWFVENTIEKELEARGFGKKKKSRLSKSGSSR